MKKIMGALLCTVMLLTGQTTLADDIQRGDEKEAMELVKKAVAYIKQHGKEKGLAEISSPSGQFRNKDLFVAVYDLKGINLAHGVTAKAIGKNLYEVTDVDGKHWMQERLAIAKAKGSGWQEYKFPHPVSKKIEIKRSYFELVDDFVVNCGYNKPYVY